jgi:Zn-dependent peptidase ImmA (M78 family)
MRKRRWADGDVGLGEHAARRALAELGVKHPAETDIENLAFLRGAIVKRGHLAGAQARLVKRSKNAVITISEEITYRPRQRFAIAHELGHLEAHKTENHIDTCTKEQITERYDQGTEREANAFAAEFLMPRSLWDHRVDVAKPTLDVVGVLANEFEVSFVGAAIRFVKLSPERCAAVFSCDGKIQWFARSDDFGHWIERGASLDPYTLAYDFFKKGSVGQRPETVSASAWLTSDPIEDDSELIEHCRPIPSLSATLSLLWIPSDRDF